MECEDFLRNRLVLREHQAVSTRTCVFLPNQLEIRGNLEVGGVVAVERLAQVEYHVAVHARQSEEALHGSIDFVEDRLVTELGERLRDFLFDLFLVEGADNRRLVVGGGLLVFIDENPIVNNHYFEFAHAFVTSRTSRSLRNSSRASSPARSPRQGIAPPRRPRPRASSAGSCGRWNRSGRGQSDGGHRSNM